MFDRFETFVTSVNKINRCIQKIKTEEMKEFGLKGTHVMCLYQLRRHPGGLTSAELAHFCGEDKAAISRVLTELENKKLTTLKDAGEKGKYRIPVILTEEGHNITDGMKEKIKAAVITASEGYTEKERKIFYKVLLKITDNLSRICE